jgi:hypothetical protein
MTRRWSLAVAAVVVVALLAWTVTLLLERVVVPAPDSGATAAAVPPAVETAHIRTTLFFVSSDGLSLAAVRREVPLGGDPAAQGREILRAQLQPPPAPYVAAIPPGVTLRAFYITDTGDAFVDLSPEVSSAHPGGAFSELLTVQAIVQAVTANLPSARRVQILVDGKEVETLAGHLDLRRPLAPDPSVLREN